MSLERCDIYADSRTTVNSRVCRSLAVTWACSCSLEASDSFVVRAVCLRRRTAGFRGQCAEPLPCYSSSHKPAAV
eukprot:2116878-Amphidinium_carterae.1